MYTSKQIILLAHLLTTDAVARRLYDEHHMKTTVTSRGWAAFAAEMQEGRGGVTLDELIAVYLLNEACRS